MCAFCLKQKIWENLGVKNTQKETQVNIKYFNKFDYILKINRQKVLLSFLNKINDTLNVDDV